MHPGASCCTGGMDITERTRRILTTAGAAGALTLGILGGAAPATAAPDQDPATAASASGNTGDVTADQDPANPGNYCGPYWCHEQLRGPGAGDPGGFWAQSLIWEAADRLNGYTVSFWPQDETLNVMDRRSDGYQARAQVRVSSPGGTLVDTDTYYTSYDTTFDLGSPDGSGDIPEGYNVMVRVCVGETEQCGPWSRGIA